MHSPLGDPPDNLKAQGSPVFVFGAAWSPSNWQIGTHETVGDLFEGSVYNAGGKTLSLNLGPGYTLQEWPSTDEELATLYNSLYCEIELGWGNDANGTQRRFRNLERADLAIYENGYPPEKDTTGAYRGGSDVFLVSLGYVENGTTNWTGYRYTVPTGFEPNAKWVDNNGNDDDGNFGETASWATGPTYLTLIDASDFLLDPDTWIVGVRIRNAVYGFDKAQDASGSGWAVLYGATPQNGTVPTNFQDDNGEITKYLHPKYNRYEYRYDPDITVVVPLREVQPIPEPGLFITLLSGFGTFASLRLARRWIAGRD